MDILIKVLLISTLFLIFIQDLKSNTVMLYLFIMAALFFAFQLYSNVPKETILMTLTINLSFIAAVTLLLYLIVYFVLRIPFFKAIGLGDICFFCCMAVGFSSITFLVLFSFSIFFSGLLYLTLKKSFRLKTVPLAGFQSLFIMLILLVSWSFKPIDLYLI